MNVHMSTQSYQLETKKNKMMLIISYLINKTADWIQFYINKKFHLKDSKNKKNKIFNNYDKFVNKITVTFRSVNFKKKAEQKLKHLKQKKLTSIYITDFKQIISILDWNDEAYVSLFYWELKNEIKNKLTKIK